MERVQRKFNVRLDVKQAEKEAGIILININ
jgi:hypothetical protein